MSSTTHNQLQTEETVTCLNDDLEPIQDNPPKSSRKKAAIYALICLLFVGLASLAIYWKFSEEQIVYDDSKPSGNYTGDIYEDYDTLMASMMTRHGGRHHKTCEDQVYGCCEIYTHCSVKNGYLDFHSMKISFYRTLPIDRIHSNCPSLDDLVHQWNIHYENKTLPCERSKFGCCPSIHTGCDNALREYRGNDDETVDYFKTSSGRTHKMKDAKINERGTNCPGYHIGSPEYGLIHGWEEYYPSRDNEGVYGWIALMVIVFGFLGVKATARQ
jgi:hypothetical protein